MGRRGVGWLAGCGCRDRPRDAGQGRGDGEAKQGRTRTAVQRQAGAAAAPPRTCGARPRRPPASRAPAGCRDRGPPAGEAGVAWEVRGRTDVGGSGGGRYRQVAEGRAGLWEPSGHPGPCRARTHLGGAARLCVQRCLLRAQLVGLAGRLGAAQGGGKAEEGRECSAGTGGSVLGGSLGQAGRRPAPRAHVRPLAAAASAARRSASQATSSARMAACSARTCGCGEEGREREERARVPSLHVSSWPSAL